MADVSHQNGGSGSILERVYRHSLEIVKRVSDNYFSSHPTTKFKFIFKGYGKSFKQFEMTEERLEPCETQYKAVNIIQILISLECPKDSTELATWLKKIEVLQNLVAKFWELDLTGRIMIECLNLLYDVIAVNQFTVSPAVWCVLDLVEKERIKDIVEGILCDPCSNEDIKVQNALTAIVDGLCQYGPRAPSLQYWALSIIQSLQMRKNYAILTAVAEATIVNLTLGFMMQIFRPLIYPVYRIFLYSSMSPHVFNKVVDKAVRVILELEKKLEDEDTRMCLADFSGLLKLLITRFPPTPSQEADYNAIRIAILRQPDVVFEPIALTLWIGEESRSVVDWKLQPLMQGYEYTNIGPYKGLVNQGNTCFLNSVLQVLYMTTRFRSEILHKDVDPTERAASDLQQLFAFMQESNRSVLVPKIVMESSMPPTFRKGHQQDSSEYLIYLLDTLHENECKVLKLKEQVITSIQESIEKKQEGAEGEAAPFDPKPVNDEENTIVERLFGGVLTSTTICSFCKKAFPKNDSFRDLHLPLPDEPKLSDLQELINATLEPEELSNENMYDCSSCGMKRNATRWQNLVKAPEHLILTLKLFRFDPIRKQRLKLQSRLSTATTVEIPIYQSSQLQGRVKYDVKAIVFHSGVSLDGGHYFSSAVDETGTWYLFNDSVVSATKCDWSIGYATPYIIILRQSHITDPPKVLLPTYLQNLVNRDNQKYSGDKRIIEKVKVEKKKDNEDDYDGSPPGNGPLGGKGSSLVF